MEKKVPSTDKKFISFLLNHMCSTKPEEMKLQLEDLSKYMLTLDPKCEPNLYRKQYGNLKTCLKLPFVSDVFFLDNNLVKFKSKEEILHCKDRALTSNPNKQKAKKMEGMLVFGSYKLGRKLGSGSFGKIYQATSFETGESVAIKFENATVKHSQLINEAKVMKLLMGKKGIPKIYCAGVEGEYNVMVMEYLGYSLEALFTNCGRKLSLKTSLMVMDQMVELVRHVHSNLFLHRDIKPDNFLMGVGENEAVVYAIDFGLAKRYRDPKTGCHIMYRTNKSLTGTARYTSLNTHLGIEQSRRDDLEGILYSVLYFLRGSLPWQGLPAKNKYDKYAKIKEVKTKTSVEMLCKDLPVEIPKMLKYCHALKFEEDPNYDFFSEQITLMMNNYGYEYDYVYDWTTGLPRFDRHSLSQQPPNGTRAQSPFLNNARNPEERESKAYDSRVSQGQERARVTDHNSLAVQYTHTLPHIPESSKKPEATPIILQDEKEGGEIHKLCCHII